MCRPLSSPRHRGARPARFGWCGCSAADPVQVHALDNEEAKAVGRLCGASGTSDVVDASVVLVARRVGGVTLSSDPDDLRGLDPHLAVVDC